MNTTDEEPLEEADAYYVISGGKAYRCSRETAIKHRRLGDRVMVGDKL